MSSINRRFSTKWCLCFGLNSDNIKTVIVASAQITGSVFYHFMSEGDADIGLNDVVLEWFSGLRRLSDIRSKMSRKKREKMLIHLQGAL